jgi:hypothetical protein
VAFLLLICAAATTNALQNGTDEAGIEDSRNIQHIFGQAIIEFVQPFDEPASSPEASKGSSSDSDQEQLYSLTHRNAAYMLKEIEVNVANKFLTKSGCNKIEIG